MAIRSGSAGLLLFGALVGGGGFALGAVLATGHHGWEAVLWYSVVGLIGAPLSALSWRSRRSNRRTYMACAALALGLITTLVLLLEFTHETSGLTSAWSQVPLLVAVWLAIWLAWQLAALARVVMFQPPRMRQRLSSRRGDRGI